MVSYELDLRSQYTWIPTDVLINNDLKARLLGPIHNLPMKNNYDLFTNIVKIFEGMLPGFQKLNLLSALVKKKETKLQVVVKAQTYV